MTVRDWLTYPKRDGDWNAWGLRANAWMNEIRTQVNQNKTDIAAISAVGGTWGAYSPTYAGFTYVATPVARYRNNGTVEYWFSGEVLTVTSGPGVFVTFSLPVAAHASLVGTTGSANGSVWAVDVSSNLRYEGVARFDTSTTISIRYPDFTFAATTAWHSNSPSQPHAWAPGDTINFHIAYEPA